MQTHNLSREQRDALLESLLNAIEPRRMCDATAWHRNRIRRCGRVLNHRGAHRSGTLTWPNARRRRRGARC